MDLAELAASGIGLLTSGASGGLLGVIGSIASGYVRAKQADQELQLEKLRFEQKLALLKFKAEQGRLASEYDALGKAIEADSATSERVSPWIADVKSLWRPLLTILLLGLSAFIFQQLLDGSLVLDGGSPRAEMLAYIARTIVFTTALAISFWFGSRAVAPPRLGK